MSYLVPVRLRRKKGSENPLLELYYYRGRFQLATADALYSDGDQYRPMRIAYHYLGDELGKVNSVLVLGTGLASAVQILEKKGYNPEFTLVEYDMTVLSWAMALLPTKADKVTPVHADAKDYMATNQQRFDLLILDVFNGRVVPPFVTSEEFLQQCRNSINEGGFFVFNYIIQNDEEWKRVDTLVSRVFPHSFCIDSDINRIIISKV